MSDACPIALLAGEGEVPLRVFEELKFAKKKVLLLAIKGLTAPALVEKADLVVPLHYTQLGKAISACKKYGAKELIMVGRVHHTRIFSISLIKLDWLALKFWFKLKDKRADSILGALASTFATHGITLLSSVKYLERFIAKEGILTSKAPSSQIWDDIQFASKLAKEIGRLDIGQTVVVKNGSIVAVEAMEGTDLCLQRAGEIAGPGCVVVKMAKPQQDMRFDVPVIGLNTIEKLIKIKAAALAIEAGKTIVLDKEIKTLADANDLIIVSLAQEKVLLPCAH